MARDTAASKMAASLGSGRILLLVDGERNRRLLADELGKSFEVLTASDGAVTDLAFDVCLFDAPSFGKHRDALEGRKRDEAPLYLPYVLLMAESRSLDDFPADVRGLVDEVVKRPSSRTEFNARIETLLSHRRLSVDLWLEKERSERRFETLFFSTPDPVVVVDADGSISAANRRFEAVFEAGDSGVAGMSIAALPIEPMDVVEAVLVSGETDPDRVPIVTLNATTSSPIVSELNVETVETVDGRVERIGVFRDVTERVERERELEEERARLEEFADTIAHDLRNPLSVAQGRLGYARAGGEEHFDVIRRSLDRMEEMIDDLLVLAKQGDAISERETVALRSVIEEAWRTVEGEHATLEVEFDRSVSVTADRSRFLELLENVFRNAVQHGGDRTTVRVGLLDDGGLFIEDDGPGIPQAERENVFEAGVTGDIDGTGFGLAIVRQIVDGHDWDVEICDGTDGGARFEIYF